MIQSHNLNIEDDVLFCLSRLSYSSGFMISRERINGTHKFHIRSPGIKPEAWQ